MNRAQQRQFAIAFYIGGLTIVSLLSFVRYEREHRENLRLSAELRRAEQTAEQNRRSQQSWAYALKRLADEHQHARGEVARYRTEAEDLSRRLKRYESPGPTGDVAASTRGADR